MASLSDPVRMRQTASAVLGGYVLAHLLLALLPLAESVRGSISAIMYQCSMLIACVAVVYARQRLVGNERKLWTYFSLALASFAAGGLWRTYSYFAFGVNPKTPSLEDVGLLLGVLLIAPVMLDLGSPGGTGRLRRVGTGMDLFSTMLVVFILLRVFVLRPLGLAEPGEHTVRTALFTAYAVATMGFVLFPVFFRGNAWTPWGRLIALGAAAGASGVIATLIGVFAHAYVIGSRAGTLIDTFLVLTYCMFALSGVWRATYAAETSVGVKPLIELPQWPATAVTVLSLFAIPLTIYAAISTSDPVETTLLATSAALLAIIVVGRSALYAYENRTVTELQRSLDRYRTPLDGAPVAIVIVDTKARILYANRAAAALAEADSRDDLIDLNLAELIPIDQRTAEAYLALETLLSTIGSGSNAPEEPTVPLRAEIMTLGGRRIPIEQTATAIAYDGGPALLIEAQDISTRVEAERKVSEYRDRLRALAAEVVAVEERERRVLAQALDDEVGQALAVARSRLMTAHAEDLCAGADVEIALEMIDRAIAQTRWLTTELAPQVLYELGFEQGMRWLCEQMRSSHGLSCEFTGSVENENLCDECRAALFRSTRELLMNVVKHAHCDTARMILSSDSTTVSVTVVDDGAGFDPAMLGARPTDSFGIFSVQERLAQLGGGLEIESAPGDGTRVTATIRRGAHGSKSSG